MQPRNNTSGDSHSKSAPNAKPADPGHVKEAHEQADADIEKDPDFMPGNDAEDLDEAESVKLNDDENDLI